jgi:rRNA-processing protein FCF1
MLVTCLPGTDRKSVRDALSTQHTTVINLRGSGAGSAYTRLLDYLDWTNVAATTLSRLISAADVERLILTPQYHVLVAGLGTMAGTESQRVVNGLVSAELDQRVEAFEKAIKALDAQIGQWSTTAEFVVLDTSVYIQHPQKLEELEIAPFLKLDHENIHVLVPIIVVDELDGLKQSKDRTTRWWAGYTLAVLDRLFERRTGQVVLRQANFLEARSGAVLRGEVSIELVFDPPGHVRLPINDDEIVDRAKSIEPLAARNIWLVTYDTGQSMRARSQGLKAVKLRQPLGDEPTGTNSI